MRETKFKLFYWSELMDGGSILHVSKPINFLDMICCREFEVYWNNGSSLGSGAIDSNNTKWVQYTGIKDKNGVEIYEGDILAVSLNKDWLDAVGVVSFVIDRFCWTWGKLEDEGCYKQCVVSEIMHEAIVCGNIHENPDLLEKES